MRSFSSPVACRTLALVLVVGVSLVADAARADAVIDNFTNGQALSSGVGVGAFGPLNSTVGGGGILGGSRTMTLSGSAFANQTVIGSVGSGFADYQSGSRSSGTNSLIYDGAGSGLGGLLAMSAFIDVSVNAFNAGSTSSTLSVAVDDGGGPVTRSVSLGGSTLIPQVFSFDFTAAGINFNSVNSVTLTLNSTGANGADITLNGFVARMTAIPEPAAVAVWSVLGAVGLVAGRKLRRSRDATRQR